MDYFTKVLVCVAEAGGDAALRHAARLASATDAKVTLADVLEDVPRLVRRFLPKSWNVPERVREQKQHHLERSAVRARRFGVEPGTALLRGAPVNALVGEVKRGGYDLLVVNAGSAENVQSTRTTTVRLVRESPCPVLFVHGSRPRRRQRIAVAIDAAEFRPDSTRTLNNTLFDVALSLAERERADLHVLYVWDAYGERYLARGGLTETAIRRFAIQVQHEASRELAETVAPFRERLGSSRVHLVRGDPRTAIAAFASRREMDLLVIGTVARTGLAGHLVGNTAEAVLAELPCSVLVVRSDAARRGAGRNTRDTGSRAGDQLERVG